MPAFKDLILVLAIATAGVGVTLMGAVTQPKVDVKFGQRTIAVADPNRHSLTIIGGVGELWICINHSDVKVDGRTCKSSEDVRNWITRNGDEQ